MIHLILDTNAIILQPDIIAKGSPEIKILIPEQVVTELANTTFARVAGGRQLLELVYRALDRQWVKQISPAVPVGMLASTGFSDADLAILASAKKYADELDESDAQNVYVITRDRHLISYASSVGIKAVEPSDDVIRNLAVGNKALNRGAIEVHQAQVRGRRLGLFIGAVISLLGHAIFFYMEKIVTSINIWFTIAALPIVVVLLYLFRARRRFAYGIAEFLFGGIAALSVFAPDFDYSRLDTTGGVKIVGGLYIMVRGMDNINKSGALRGTRKIGPLWRKLFKEE